MFYKSVLWSTEGSSGNSGNLVIRRTVLGVICDTAENRPLSIAGLHDLLPLIDGKFSLSRKELRAALVSSSRFALVFLKRLFDVPAAQLLLK